MNFRTSIVIYLSCRTRRLRRWIEDLDRKDDDYFGYGDDRTIILRKLARPLKSLVERVTGRQFNSSAQSTKVLSRQARQAAKASPALQETTAFNSGTSREKVAYYYLPFALPDEVRIPLYSPSAPQKADGLKPQQTSPRPVPGPQVPARTTRRRLQRWVGMIAGVAAIYMLVVRPLTVHVDPPAQALSQNSVQMSESEALKRELEQVRAELKELQKKTVIARTETESGSPASQFPMTSDRSVPEPYTP